MDREKFLRRGWVCGLISPAACVIFMLLQLAGVWESKGYIAVVLAAILVVEMLVGTIAPFWWLLTLYRKGRTAAGKPTILIGLNIFAVLVSLVFFF